jgi:8-oxo-dGTP diphosphatase
MPYTYDYPRPALTADILLLGIAQDQTAHLLLIERKHPPFAGCWALPGGFMDEQEPIETTAMRELKEETGLEGVPLYQWRTYSTPGRDPRGRVVSVVFVGCCLIEQHPTVAADDAAALRWWSLHALPAMAFDHGQIVREAFDYLRQLSESSLQYLYPALAVHRHSWLKSIR